MSATANCCHCGRIVDTREEADGGDAFGSELEDGRWTCSAACWENIVCPEDVTPMYAPGRDPEIARLKAVLLRIAIRDRHTRRIKPNPDGGLRGVGGMIATFALTGKNGSYVTDEEIIAAHPDIAMLEA